MKITFDVMNRNALIIIMIFASVILIIQGVSSAKEDENVVAIVQVVQGSVDVAAAGGDEWSPLKVGDTLVEGDKVKTGKDGTAAIFWSAGHVMKVSELTVVNIEKLQFRSKNKKETSVLDVKSGKVFIKARKLASRDSIFEVSTPTAVAAVRGTEFMVEVPSEGSSTISLLDGKLDVSGEDIAVNLGEKMQVRIDTSVDTKPEPVEVPSETLQEMELESSDIADLQEQVDAKGSDKDSGRSKAESSSTETGEGDTDTIDDLESYTDSNYVDEDIKAIQEILDDNLLSVQDDIVIETEELNVPPMPPSR